MSVSAVLREAVRCSLSVICREIAEYAPRDAGGPEVAP